MVDKFFVLFSVALCILYIYIYIPSSSFTCKEASFKSQQKNKIGKILEKHIKRGNDTHDCHSYDLVGLEPLFRPLLLSNFAFFFLKFVLCVVKCG